LCINTISGLSRQDAAPTIRSVFFAVFTQPRPKADIEIRPIWAD
jgi:hypothetical protein